MKVNSNNKITKDDIKKISAMNNAEIEKKLKEILADSKNGALKKMLSGIDLNGMKKKLQSAGSSEIDGVMSMLGKLDPAIVGKIKDALK